MDDQTQYEQVCRPGFVRIDANIQELIGKIDRLDMLIRGENGNSRGLTTRQAILEDRDGGLVRACWVLFGSLLATVSAIVVMFVRSI